MAKEKNSPQSRTTPASPGGLSLAERLYVSNWRIGSQSTDEHIATRCMEAAEAFEAAKIKRAMPPQSEVQEDIETDQTNEDELNSL